MARPLRVARRGGEIELWDIDTRSERKLRGHSDAVTDVTFFQDGQSLASSSRDGTTRVWDVRTGRLLHTLGDHPRPCTWDAPCSTAVNSVAFSPDGALLATGGADGEIVLWDGPKRDSAPRPRRRWRRGAWCELQPDGGRVVSGDDGFVRMWDPRTGEEVMKMTSPGWSAETGGVTVVAFVPADRSWLPQAFFRDKRTEVTLWDVGSGRVMRAIDAGKNEVTRLAFDASGSVLAIAGDGGVLSWDVHWGSAAEACQLPRAQIFLPNASVPHSVASRRGPATGNDTMSSCDDEANGGSPGSGRTSNVSSQQTDCSTTVSSPWGRLAVD